METQHEVPAERATASVAEAATVSPKSGSAEKVRAVEPPSESGSDTTQPSDASTESDSVENSIGIEMVWVPGLKAGGRWPGKKESGAWVGKFEITQAQYQRLTGQNPSHFQPRLAQEEGWKWEARLPVENVTWEEAITFCVQLTETERKAGRLSRRWAYRLPTQGQWLDFVADALINENLAVIATNRPATVGSKEANVLGLFDVRGNVNEWLGDKKRRQNPELTRGAFDSRYIAKSPPWFFRTKELDYASADVGFRVVLVPGK